MNNIFSRKNPAFPATIYVLVYTLYTIAFSFQLGVSIIRPLYITYYAMSLWYLYKVTKLNGTSSFIRALSVMFSLICLYGILLIVNGTSGWYYGFDSSTFLMSHATSIIPIYVFYYFGRRGILSPSWFRIMFVFFCVDAYASFYAGQWVMTNIMLSAGLDVSEGFTNNSGYAVVSLLPLVAFLNKKSIIQYSAIIIILIAAVLCVKRGAILVGILSVLYFLYNTLKTQKSSKKIPLLILSLVSAVVVYIYIGQLYSSNDYFNARMSSAAEGDTSGRDVIWTFFWNYFISAENGIGILIGNGANATVRLRGIEAHSDWFEYAIDMGLLGVFLFLVYWIVVYRYYKKAKCNLSSEIVIAMGMVIIINFFRTFFSMSFNDMTFMTAAVLGYTTSSVDNVYLMKTETFHTVVKKF